MRASLLRIRSGNSGVLPVILAIVIVAVVFEIITPEHAYLRPSNLVYIFGLSTVYMILAIAETIVLLIAEVDLSVGAVALIGGAIAFKLVQQPGPTGRGGPRYSPRSLSAARSAPSRERWSRCCASRPSS